MTIEWKTARRERALRSLELYDTAEASYTDLSAAAPVEFEVA